MASLLFLACPLTGIADFTEIPITAWPFVLGRNRHAANLAIPAASVSSVHCRIRREPLLESPDLAAEERSGADGFVYVLEDCSTNGVYVNDRRVKSRCVSLSHRDEISLAARGPTPDAPLNFFVFFLSAPPNTPAIPDTPSQYLYCDRRYSLGKRVLGTGAFSSVLVAYDRVAMQRRAAKVILRRAFALKPKQREHIAREIKIFQSVDHVRNAVQSPTTPLTQ